LSRKIKHIKLLVLFWKEIIQ